MEFKKKIDKAEMDGLPVFVFSGEVIVVENEEQANEAINHLASCACIGFDTETRPSFKKGQVNKVGLIQLATDDRVYLFRLNKLGFLPALRRLMADRAVLKVGVGIRDDIKSLRRLSDFIPASFVDLQDYAVDFGIEDKSFSKLMAIIFNVKISKRQRVTNWNAPQLTEAQIRYAATDAWGALEMYQRLSAAC